jgi:hypothetical protein
MNTSNLETRLYVATDADIDSMADKMFSAQEAADTIPRQFLRATIATTIHELGADQRARSGKVLKLSDEDKAVQLAAFGKVYERFLARVTEKAKKDLPSAVAGRAKLLNAKTNWARTNALVVRNWIRAGNDIRTVAAARATRASLAVTPRVRTVSPGRLKAKVENRSKELVASVMELAALDKTAAVAEMQLLMGQLMNQLEELGVKSTKDAKEAVAEHRPLRVGRQTFFPTHTAVIRQMENPS